MEWILVSSKCQPKVWKDVEAICNTFQANEPNQQFAFHANGPNKSNLVRDALMVFDPPRPNQNKSAQSYLSIMCVPNWTFTPKFLFSPYPMHFHFLFLLYQSYHLHLSLRSRSWSWIIHQNVSKKKMIHKTQTDSYFTPWTRERSLPSKHGNVNVNNEHWTCEHMKIRMTSRRRWSTR